MEDRPGASEGEVGGHIQYQTGISLDDKQREYWSLYTAENREKYFWIFLNSFVEKWEQKVFFALVSYRQTDCQYWQYVAWSWLAWNQKSMNQILNRNSALFQMT